MNDSDVEANIAQNSEVNALVSYDVLELFNFILIVMVPTIAVPGVAFNLINVIIFTRIGLADTINTSLLGLAVADTGVLVTMLGYCVLFNPLTMAAASSVDLIYAVDYVTLGTPHVLFSRISGLLTGMVSLERLVCVTWPLHVKTLVTRRRTSFAVCGAYALMFLSSVPAFVAYRIGPRFSPEWNATVVGLILAANSEDLESFTFSVNLTVQMVSFVIVTASTLFLTRSLHHATEWRSSICRPATDASRRNKQLVKMVILMSAVFIVCSLPTVLVNALMQFFQEFSLKGRERNVFVLTCGVFFVLQSINATVNIFIYLAMGSRFKRSFYSLFGTTPNSGKFLNDSKSRNEYKTAI